jgi:hypothetical protein
LGEVTLEKLTATQPVKKFHAFYETRRFIAVFTTARHTPYPEPDESRPQIIFQVVFCYDKFRLNVLCVSHFFAAIYVTLTKQFCKTETALRAS